MPANLSRNLLCGIKRTAFAPKFTERPWYILTGFRTEELDSAKTFYPFALDVLPMPFVRQKYSNAKCVFTLLIRTLISKGVERWNRNYHGEISLLRLWAEYDLRDMPDIYNRTGQN